MVTKPFYRLVHAWVMILVIALHGLAVWAGVSVENVERLIIKAKPSSPIQLELVTLDSATLAGLANTTPDLEAQSDKVVLPKQKAEPEKEAVNKKVIEPIEIIKPKKEIPIEKETLIEQETLAQKPITAEADLSDKTKPNKMPVDRSDKVVEKNQKLTNQAKGDPINNNSKTKTEQQAQDTPNSVDGTEDDLSAMIRAVTAQFNREQAMQQRATKLQTNNKMSERAKWQAQAEEESITKILALAAEQAANQALEKDIETRQEHVDDTNADGNELIPFLEEQGSWLEEHEPITDVPLLIWRNTDARSGEVFIVLLELAVDKAGVITEVQLLESSGSAIIDAVATTQVRTGQLTPLQVDGLVVEAIIPMSLVYQRP